MPIYYIDGTGTPQGRGWNWGTVTPPPPPPPPPPSSTTIYGFNFNNTDTANQTIAGREAWWSSRVPCVRVYGTSGQTSSFTVSTTVAVEKRVCYSFKDGGGFTTAQLGNGAATATMVAWLQSIPANWTVYWVYHHEPNGSGGLEVPVADFLGTYHQMRLALNRATLKSGVKVFITCNFMAFQLSGSTWSDSWVPPRADCDILTWDIYGNPGNNTSATGTNKYGGPATGKGYGTTYALASVRTSDMFAVTERTGFADSWGILELNAPARDWDTTGTGGEHGRVLWHQDMLGLITAPPMTGGKPPQIVLLWEAPSGANWDQSFGRLASSTTAPMVNFWAPYITGTPVGGP